MLACLYVFSTRDRPPVQKRCILPFKHEESRATTSPAFSLHLSLHVRLFKHFRRTPCSYFPHTQHTNEITTKKETSKLTPHAELSTLFCVPQPKRRAAKGSHAHTYANSTRILCALGRSSCMKLPCLYVPIVFWQTRKVPKIVMASCLLVLGGACRKTAARHPESNTNSRKIRKIGQKTIKEWYARLVENVLCLSLSRITEDAQGTKRKK